jgi:ubiquinone/menaquinone biosynthesis C-methylase UbiE
MTKSIDNTRVLYNKYSFGTFNYGNKRDKFESLLFEFLKYVTPDSVLYDVGCGSGYWLDAYLHMGISKDSIYCIDLAKANIEVLQKKGFNAIIGDVMDLYNVPSYSSDLTVSIGVIHCTNDPFKSFNELVRITKPGGRIYLNVYKYHPYYYVVHRATFPIRYIYWNYNKKVADVAYWFAKILFQPLAYLVFGKFLDDKTGKTMFMDQVITPKAHMFSKKIIMDYASNCGCTVEAFRYNRYNLMLSAIILVNDIVPSSKVHEPVSSK